MCSTEEREAGGVELELAGPELLTACAWRKKHDLSKIICKEHESNHP